MKRLLALSLIACMLVGCGAAGSSEPAQSQQEASAEQETSDGESDTLVLYTARAESLNNAVIENFQADTGIKVEIVTGSTGEVVKRVQSEAANPQGDVLWAGSEAQLAEYVDYLESYVSPEDENMLYKNTSGYFSNAFCDPTVFIVNNELAEGMKIEGFEDLLNPALKGKIAYGDPVNSSSAFQCLIAALYDMGDGDPMSDAAWDWVEKFIANLDGVSLDSSSKVYKGTAEGEYVVGLIWEDPVADYVRQGVDVRVVFPEEGALMPGMSVSVIKGAPNMENAKKFVDYMLSEKCQSYVGENLTVRPLRDGANLNEFLKPWSEITICETYDDAWVQENKTLVTEKYTEYLENSMQ
ncbi:MAG: extracellular solute-binding protein [Lachnospiraceae bacterium]|nr:extracellular solute-binding protein [Lachnospiraceae bacterium]